MTEYIVARLFFKEVRAKSPNITVPALHPIPTIHIKRNQHFNQVIILHKK